MLYLVIFLKNKLGELSLIETKINSFSLIECKQ